MDVTLRHVKADTEDYDYVADLYFFSFPEREREKIENIMIVSETDFGEFSVVLDGEERIGLLYVLVQKDLVYIYYLAVDPGKRGRGYGSATLSLVKSMYPGFRFVLSSEAPNGTAENNEQRIERIAFYEKNGFRDTGKRSTWDGVEYAQMLCGDHIGRFEVGRIFKRHHKLSRRAKQRSTLFV
jgi:ribosomal protein S18 acetylase RimI-like enzyme